MPKKEKGKVLGIGTNDADYSVVVHGMAGETTHVCPFYSKWRHMLNRCYNPKEHEKRPSYKGCIVCEEWFLFSNFKSWMEQQDWEGKQLDKDLCGGSGVYSPSTCVFISAQLNSFLTESNKSRGEFPLGVYYHKRSKKYRAQISLGNTRKYLGDFNTPMEAHKAWQKAKIQKYKSYIEEFSTEDNIKESLTLLKNKLEICLETNQEYYGFRKE